MARSKCAIVGILFILAHFPSWSQGHRFAVFFSDKNATEYTVDQPGEFLSARAIERRQKQEIPIIEQDFPVNANYVTGIKDLGIKVWYSSRWLNMILIEADSSRLPELTSLAFVSDIEFVAPGKLGGTNGRSKHGRIKYNGRSGSATFQNQILGVDSMHSQGYTGQDMLIGIFDGGFENADEISAFDHLRNASKIKATFDYVTNTNDVYRYSDHGTQAFSTIGASDPSTMTGTAPDADFILCVTEDVFSEYRVEEYNWLFAAEFADSAGVDVINTSLGYNTFDDPSMNYTAADLDGNTAVISWAASIAATKGIVIVVSAGNSGSGSWKFITTPADGLDVLAVGAIQPDSLKASFSSFGPTADGRIKPDVVALGVQVSTIDQSGQVAQSNGTSFAAPQVAGLVAGYWQAHPEMGYKEVLDAIRNSGNQAGQPNNATGWGLPNFNNTRQLVTGLDEVEDFFFSVYPNPIKGNKLLIKSNVNSGSFSFRLYSSAGQVLAQESRTFNATNSVALDLPDLTPGLYILSLTSKHRNQKVKLIKY
ncbi:MAG: S8 family serine peptidase [Cyclobacteriaceae bacterium]